MRIYTRTGDAGETGLFDGSRVPKDTLRVEAYGTLDELNSLLGVIRADGLPADADAFLRRVQSELFDLGAELATPEPDKSARTARVPRTRARQVEALERAIDGFMAEAPPLRTFVLPGGNRAAALVHLARTVARRAERRVVTLSRAETLNPELVRYLNRLSDSLFALARALNHRAGEAEDPWEPAR